MNKTKRMAVLEHRRKAKKAKQKRSGTATQVRPAAAPPRASAPARAKK